MRLGMRRRESLGESRRRMNDRKKAARDAGEALGKLLLLAEWTDAELDEVTRIDPRADGLDRATVRVGIQILERLVASWKRSLAKIEK